VIRWIVVAAVVAGGALSGAAAAHGASTVRPATRGELADTLRHLDVRLGGRRAAAPRKLPTKNRRAGTFRHSRRVAGFGVASAGWLLAALVLWRWRRARRRRPLVGVSVHAA